MHVLPRLLLAAACLIAAVPAVARPLGLGTMAPGTVSHTSGVLIGRLVHQQLGLQIRVQPHGGESVLMPLLEQGELDFAIAGIAEAADAYTGQRAFADAPQRRLRVAAVLFPLRVALFVRADSDIHSIADLAGQRLPSGFAAMASVNRLLAALLANGGLGVGDVRPVPVAGVVQGAELFASGRADAFFFAVGAARVREVDAVTPLRMLPLDAGAVALRATRGVFAEAYSSTVAPAPGLAGVRAPVAALTFDNLLLTATHVPAQTVAAVVAAIESQRLQLAGDFAPFRETGTRTLPAPDLPLPFHEGTPEWARTR